ncbi:MAG: AbrB/MazE/SpoVT family DNA-binding domain-containing protein [Candidatus Microsaccharimonas sp.]|jgi:AbrB family looped-hinge helix DNA binding protein
MHDKKLYGTASVGSKGQVVIPADARQALNIQPGDRLYVVGSEKSHWVGFIPEDQLRHMVEHLTSDIESYRSLLEKTDKE